MQEVKILGISGSPRKGANTAILVKKVLEGASSVPGVKTEFYEMAGKKIHHCVGCMKCLDKGICIIKDDFQDLVKRWMEADGIIWGAPVYRMGVPGSMKAAMDRLGNSTRCHWGKLGRATPRYNKVCGVAAVGADRYGGQELVLDYLMTQAVLMHCLVVSGDTSVGSYIGAPAWTMPERVGDNSKDTVLGDERGMACAVSVGKRVAETAKIVKAGISALKKDLPDEYFYIWQVIE